MPTATATFVRQFSNPSVTWDDLAFLREHTSLPVVLKGILHPDDARLAVEHGVDGIIVSNHGGRQVDGAIGALDALPAVVQAVAGACEVLFDSGIRSGADAFKALALGARAVLLGRPFLSGPTVGGQRGVVDVLRAFLAELDLTMALSGCATIDRWGGRLGGGREAGRGDGRGGRPWMRWWRGASGAGRAGGRGTTTAGRARPARPGACLGGGRGRGGPSRGVRLRPWGDPGRVRGFCSYLP